MDRATPRPNTTPRALAEAEARRAREAEALRENLRKRKLQARRRDAGTDESPDRAGEPPCR